MKKPNKLIFPFLYGVLFMSGVLILVQCNKNNDPLFDEYKQSELELDIDYKAINKTGKEIEQLLNDGNQEAMIEMMFEDAFTDNKYKPQYSTEELETIANAFKKRKLTTATEVFAEYTYTIDGVDYTMTMGMEEEGIWKIVRF